MKKCENRKDLALESLVMRADALSSWETLNAEGQVGGSQHRSQTQASGGTLIHSDGFSH